MKPGAGSALSCAKTLPVAVMTAKSRLNQTAPQSAVLTFFIVPSIGDPAFEAGYDFLNVLIDSM
jgi:hypothetical protein